MLCGLLCTLYSPVGAKRSCESIGGIDLNSSEVSTLKLCHRPFVLNGVGAVAVEVEPAAPSPPLDEERQPVSSV